MFVIYVLPIMVLHFASMDRVKSFILTGQGKPLIW